MGTTEEPSQERRERGSSKLLAEWGQAGPVGSATSHWAQVLRRDAQPLLAPRVVVSGTAFPDLLRRGALTGAVRV